MKILLLNDNPVVNKLVTLSAQKTSDELDVVDSIDSIQPGEYDLLVVDDTMYNDDMLSEIKSKIMFSSSLYICSRDAAEVKAFSSTLKKPFLPTDLVDLFLKFSKEVNTSSSSQEKIATDLEELEEFDSQELKIEKEVGEDLVLDEDIDLSFDSELDELDELKTEELDELKTEELDDNLALDEDMDLSLDDELGDLDDELLLEDDELLLDDDDELSLDEELDEELSLSDEDIDGGESILDDEEAQKVKDLLDETSDDEASQKIPEYDPQFAANELGLPVEEIEEFIQDFINQAYEFKDELYSSLENHDLDNIKALSHKIKGVAANLRMQEALDAITVVNESSDSDEIEASLDDFYKIVDKLAGINSSSSSDEEETTDLDELEEFSSEELELEDELTFDEEEAEAEIDKAVTEELALEEELTLDEEELELDEEEVPAEFEDELAFDEEEAEVAIDEAITEELELDEDLELESDEELDLETQIENAVEELSDEDLESELDEETLLEIATNEIDDFSSLNSNDLKLAFGEEVNSEEPELSSDDTDLDKLEELNQEITTSEETEVKANTVEALENLLAALKDKNVVASMKGTKININITIGDE